MRTYEQFIPTVLATMTPNHLLILGLLLLLKLIGNNHFMAVETFLQGEQQSDFLCRDFVLYTSILEDTLG